MDEARKFQKSLGYLIKQIENDFNVFVLWKKHEWRNYNHTCDSTKYFPVWNEVIYGSSTAQR